MTDIASLGVEVKTDQADKGAKDLDKFAAAAASAELKVERLKAAQARANAQQSLAAERAARAATAETTLAAAKAKTAATIEQSAAKTLAAEASIEAQIARTEMMQNRLAASAAKRAAQEAAAAGVVERSAALTAKASSQAEKASEQAALTTTRKTLTEAKLSAEIARRALIEQRAAVQAQAANENVIAATNRRIATELRLQAQLAKTDAQMFAANSNKLGRFGNTSTANIAAQFQDIGVTAAGGMSPMIIALQQGTQLSAIMTQMENPVKELGAAFFQVISPLALLTIGIVALVAAGIQFIDWASTASYILNAVASAMEAVAPYAIAAAAALALIYAPAIVTGMVSLIALIARVGVAATIAGGQMAAAWLIGLGPVGLIIAAIAAVTAAAYAFRDEIQQVFGVDLFGIIKDVVNFMINSFKAAYVDIEFVWNNFPALMGRIGKIAANLFIMQIEAMINNTIMQINALFGAVSAIASKFGLEGIGEIPEIQLPRIDITDTGLEQAIEERNKAIQDAMSEDTLGQWGAKIGAGASWAADKVRDLAKWMGTVDEKDKKAKGGKTDEDKFDTIATRAENKLREMLAERDAIGLTEQAAAALRYEQEMLNEAQRAGISLTPQQTQYFRMLAEEMAKTEEETRRLKDALDFAKDMVKGFIQDFVSGLRQGKSVWESFGDAAMNVLDKIVDKLLNELLDAIFQVGNSGSGGGIGGIFNWILGLFKAAKGAVFAGGDVVPFADGGIVQSPTMFQMKSGAGLMGEAGPEAIMPLKRGPDGKLGVASSGRAAASQASSQQSVSISVGVTVDDDGKIRAYVREETTNAVGTGLSEFSKTVPDQISAYQRDPRRRSS